ncbi:unnamed protein product [Cyclocybe aegerita]|uniref:Cupin type-2 domain-containing protein n=1 Tax=Cyclocybe aegerita TaxID=1973307 RepID=A0A8S0WS78_CYCAE|nr:unnamed protein product [Cyclocybe aegerita]
MYNDDLSPTVMAGKNTTMTFLRNEKFLVRFETPIDPTLDAVPFYVAPHWHPTHDEIFLVIKGRMQVTVGSTTRIFAPEDGEVCVPKGTVHSIQTFKGEHLIFEERTEPMDDIKEVFFRNLPPLDGGLPTNLDEAMQIALAAYHGDARPVLPLHIFWLENVFIAILGGILAPLLGWKRKYTSVKKEN